MAVTAFRGRWKKLGNFSICSVPYDGHVYKSVEHAFQAQKTTDPETQREIREQPTPGAAKCYAKTIRLRPDWEQVKIGIMLDLLREKFSREPERSLLLSTGDEELVEGNDWNDRFWGQCPVGVGENWLGRLLMHVREEVRNETPQPTLDPAPP